MSVRRPFIPALRRGAAALGLVALAAVTSGCGENLAAAPEDRAQP